MRLLFLKLYDYEPLKILLLNNINIQSLATKVCIYFTFHVNVSNINVREVTVQKMNILK